MAASKSITEQQYQMLSSAYKFFNKNLFANQLPDVMIVLNRKSEKNFGYFHAGQFVERQGEKKKKDVKRYDELSLNPDKFFSHPDMELMQTIAHEMTHAWQFHCTKKQPRGGYHDKVWGKKMEDIGLMPSNTGREGGKKTGQQMMEYVIEGGLFEKFARKFIQANKIKFGSMPQMTISKNRKKNKVTYICPSCSMKVWGKPNININCGDCDEQMTSEEVEGDE